MCNDVPSLLGLSHTKRDYIILTILIFKLKQKIMKKTLIFCAALLACAFSFQSCDKVDNPNGEGPTKAVIDNGMDLAEVVAKFADDKGVVTLPAGVELTLSAPIEFTRSISIEGDKDNPAKIVFTSEDAGFIINGGLTLNNILFDCNASQAPFIQLSKNPSVNASKVTAWDTDYYFYLISDPIEVTNCYVDGVNSFFLTDNKIENNGVWFPTDILVANSVVRLSTPANNSNYAYFYLNNGGGFAKNLVVSGSTFYNTTDYGFRYFVRYGGFGNDQVKDVFGWEDNTLSYLNSTFYNVCQNDGQWGNYNGIYRATTSYWIMTNCIFWNCSTSGSVPRRFLQGRAPAADAQNVLFLNNTYMKKDGTFQDPQNYDTTGTNIEEDPNFADPSKGDFSIKDSKQAELGTGDPRWLIPINE